MVKGVIRLASKWQALEHCRNNEESGWMSQGGNLQVGDGGLKLNFCERLKRRGNKKFPRF